MSASQVQTPLVDDQFKTVVESLPHLVWTCRADGSCDYLSPQWIAYTGVSEEDQLGYGWLERLHPDDSSRTHEQWSEASVAQDVFDIEFRIRRFDGVYRWFKIRAVPTVEDGRIIRWCGTSTDIQDLKDAEQKTAALTEQLNTRISEQTEALQGANRHLSTLTLQLQSAQRITQVGSWEFHVPTGKVIWSLELFRVFGLDPQEQPPNYQQQASLFDPPSWARLTAAIEHSVATGEGYELTLTAIRVDGERRITVARAEVLPTAEGAVETLVGTFQDVTEQHAAANRVAKLSERLQLAASAAHIGVWEWDLRTNVLTWDDAMYEIYGISADSFGGAYDAWRSAFHPDDLEQAEELIGRAAQGLGDFRTVFRIVLRDGSVRHIRAESSLHRDEDGQIARMIGVNWDITEQRTAELALRRSEALQRGILAAAGSAIIATTTDGIVTLFNPAAETLLGYKSEEVVGKLTPQAFHLEEEADARRVILERELGTPVPMFDAFVAKSRNGKPYASEWTYIHRDGSHIPVWLTVSTLRDRDEIVGYIGLASDLTSRKQHEDDLRELNELLAQRSIEAEAASGEKSRFVANMSHEIRTPIGAITGVTYLLARTELTSEQRDFVSTIERSTRSLLGMVNDVLDLAKIEAGQLALELGSFSLKEVLVDIASLMSAYGADKDIELVVDAAPDLPDHLLGDRVRLMQILTNLTGNAVKFTESGNVRLCVQLARGDSSTHQCLRFEVQDSGPGIAPDLMSRLFTPFAQGKQSGENRPAGTGLGLTIVKDLVKLMHGEIGVDSQLDKGSTFWFEVPFELAKIPRSEGPKTRALKLLIVDDHAPQRLALRSCVLSLGWEVQMVSSGMDALALMDQESEKMPFDVIVVDWKMPEMDGLETLEAIQASPLASKTPCVVLTTAFDMAALRTQPRARLANAFMSKPVTSSTLYDAVIQAVAVRDAGGNSLPASESSKEIGRLKGVGVLVVDDSSVNRDIGRRILEMEGALVVEAANGQEAAECVLSSSAKIDLVLMDVQMPIKDGVEATRIIRADGRFAGLPIIAVTAGALNTERERALAAGMTDYITKPYDPEAIIARVRAHVSRKRRLSLPSLPPPASVSEALWPTVQGIDVAEAKLRFGGDFNLFCVLLERLKLELQQVLEAGLTWSDEEQASSFFHKLRGSAGNLAARKLASLAEEAELAVDQASQEERAQLLSRLRQEMEQISLAAQLLREQSATPETQPRAAPVEPALMTQVCKLLQERSLEAAMIVEERSASFESSLGSERFARFRHAMNKLDYQSAHALLSEIKKKEEAMLLAST